MARRTLHVGIVGAGIGGLTAAIASARAGAQVTILESALELGEIGAGIQVLNVPITVVVVAEPLTFRCFLTCPGFFSGGE
jgi:thioredoxin reductase